MGLAWCLALGAVALFVVWLIFGESWFGEEPFTLPSDYPEPKVSDHYYQSPDGEAPCTRDILYYLSTDEAPCSHETVVEGRFLHQPCGLAWWQHTLDGYIDEEVSGNTSNPEEGQ